MGVALKRPSPLPAGGAVTPEESLQELAQLAASAGALVVATVLQVRERIDPATLLGRGKLEQVRDLVAQHDADLLIFDLELSPTQQRNIEELTGCRAIDRTQLILDIFARHARTREGQLQVELAQLNYLLPRLTGRGVEMSRLGGGIGTRGPGETQLEMDRRRIRSRIRRLQEALEAVRAQRLRRRSRRADVPLSTIALVGYTNAGKSTLFNRLTQAGVLESPQMFATLDPTTRLLELPSRRRVLLSDTVGFLRDLPHTLISAFRATLEEVREADLILLVSDAASPRRREQEQEVENVLREIGAPDKPLLRVASKIDLLSSEELARLSMRENQVALSAKTGQGVSALLEAIDRHLPADPIERVRLRFAQSEGAPLSQVYRAGRVLRRTDSDGFVLLDAEVPHSLLIKLQDHLAPSSRRSRWAQSR